MLIDGEDVKQAIVERLIEAFPQITVYKEAKTSISYPHFFVYQINLSVNEERKNYFQLKYSMEIRYRVVSDPSTDLKLEQNLDTMALKLLQEFNIINFEEEKIRIKDKSIEKTDGVLHFTFNIEILAKLVSNENSPTMNKLDFNIITEE